MRTRLLKPGFFANADLTVLPPLTRLFFVGLWLCADREGRLLDHPCKLKRLLLPTDACSGEEMLAQLAAAPTEDNVPFVIRYQVGKQRLLWIPGFKKQQGHGIHPQEQESRLPPADLDDSSDPPAHQGGTTIVPRRYDHRTKEVACRALPSFPSCTSCQEGGMGEPQEKSREENGAIPLPQSVLALPLPGELDNADFRGHWLAYLRYRVDSGKPYTPEGAKRQLARLAGWGSARACAALVYTMAQEYLGVVEERGPGATASKKSKAETIKEENEAWLRGKKNM